MPKFKVRLVCPVTITASLDLVMEADNEDAAYENAIEEYNRQQKEYQDKLSAYRRNYKGSYPEASCFWNVESDDAEDAVDDNDIEIDNVEEVKE